MSRGLNPTYVTSSVDLVQPYLLAYMDFSSSAVRLWTGNETKSFSDDFGGGNYLGVGTFGGYSNITETTEVASKGIELTLSGIPDDYIALSMTDNYRGRTVAVYLVLFNQSFSTYEKIMIFRGRMDQMQIEESGDTSTIKLKCESRLIDLNRQRDLRYTDEAQRSIYPSDKGFEFVASMANKSIYWGNSAPSSVGNSGASGDTGDGDGNNGQS